MYIYRNLTFIPCHLEMARSGRSALNVRRDLNCDTCPAPALSAAKLTTDIYERKEKLLYHSRLYSKIIQLKMYKVNTYNYNAEI